jgi:hypothetical protein
MGTPLQGVFLVTDAADVADEYVRCGFQVGRTSTQPQVALRPTLFVVRPDQCPRGVRHWRGVSPVLPLALAR